MVGRAVLVAYTNRVDRDISTPNLMAWRPCTQEKLSSNCQTFPDFLVGKLALPAATMGEGPGPGVARLLRAGGGKGGSPLIGRGPRGPLIPCCSNRGAVL